MSDCHIDGKFNIENSIISSNAQVKLEQKNNKVFLLGEGSKIQL